LPNNLRSQIKTANRNAFDISNQNVLLSNPQGVFLQGGKYVHKKFEFIYIGDCICQHAKDIEMKEFLSLCFTRQIVKRASVTALVVGAILIAINHGDALLSGQIDTSRLFKIILTVFVPYIVSTVSSASAILSMRKEQA
jgi:hypothetical protein